MFALERSSASFGPNLSDKLQAANSSLLHSLTQSFQLPPKVAAQQLTVNRINTMVPLAPTPPPLDLPHPSSISPGLLPPPPLRF